MNLFVSLDTVSQKLLTNNVFTIAKRNVEGQDMLYQSIKLTNGIWVLAELKIQPGNSCFMVRRCGLGLVDVLLAQIIILSVPSVMLQNVTCACHRLLSDTI